MKTISSAKNNLVFRRLVLLNMLVDQINSSFEINLFTLGIFIDLSKVLDTVDPKILISKLQTHGLEEITFNSLEPISLVGSSSLNAAT